MTNITQTRLTQVAVAVTNRRWCGYHAGFSEAAIGKDLIRGKKRIFMCRACCDKRGIK